MQKNIRLRFDKTKLLRELIFKMGIFKNPFFIYLS